MPLFEYRCDKCGRRFALLVGVTAEKAKLACPRCGHKKVTKLISRIAPVARGDDLDDFDEEGGGDFPDDLGDDLDDESDDY